MIFTEKMMVKVLMIAFGLGAILDLFMATFGMIVILQAGGPVGYVTCIVGSFALLYLRLCIKTIIIRDKLLYKFIFCSILLALALDFYAVSNSVVAYIIHKHPIGSITDVYWKELWGTTEISVLVFSTALVIFLTAAPIVLSYLLYEHNEEEDEDNKVPTEKKN